MSIQIGSQLTDVRVCEQKRIFFDPLQSSRTMRKVSHNIFFSVKRPTMSPFLEEVTYQKMLLSVVL
jgi:hypothetical protein